MMFGRALIVDVEVRENGSVASSVAAPSAAVAMTADTSRATLLQAVTGARDVE